MRVSQALPEADTGFLPLQIIVFQFAWSVGGVQNTANIAKPLRITGLEQISKKYIFWINIVEIQAITR